VKKHTKSLVKALERLGYAYAGTVGRNEDLLYRHGNGHALTIGPDIREHISRALLREAQEHCGATPAANKRNTTRLKDRAAADRARRRQLKAHKRTSDVLRVKARGLAGATGLKGEELRALTQEIERRDREYAQMKRLMTATPEGGAA
jgi:hypothetical protein